MTLRELINFSHIQPKFDKLSKSNFLIIQENFSKIMRKYLNFSNSSSFKTPKKFAKIKEITPPTFHSTPKKNSKRKLNITPKKQFSSGRRSKKVSQISIDPERLFATSLKVNLRDVFQGYVSSSDDSLGAKELSFFLVK
jgi:hypothetical protein